MSEVMRWKLKGFIPGVEGESKAVFQPVVVLAEDYDSAVRLFLDAAERCLAAERREQALQLRLNAADQRIDDIERALGGMLFAFDDGVGRDWSANLLDYARKLTSAAEFNPAESGAGERNHGIPGTSGMRLNMLANQGE